MTTSKIPKQIYIVSQNRSEFEYPDPANYNYKIETKHNFGFLHPHEPHLKADEKRKQTQHDWAYSRVRLYMLGNQYWVKGREYDYATRQSVDFDRPLDPMYAPRIWDNEPLTGFRIVDTVNRYRGNKLFKVLDPRGVEFEITVSCLFQLMMDGEVKHGEILNPCAWKGNKNLVVVA